METVLTTLISLLLSNRAGLSISDNLSAWALGQTYFAVASSENSLSSQLANELVIVETSVHVFIVALNQRAEIFVGHVEAVPGKELAQVIFVDVAIIAHIDKIEGLARGELSLLLGQDSKLLRLYLVL